MLVCCCIRIVCQIDSRNAACANGFFCLVQSRHICTSRNRRIGIHVCEKPYLSVIVTGRLFSALTKIIHPDIYIITLCRVFVNHFFSTNQFSAFCTNHIAKDVSFTSSIGCFAIISNPCISIRYCSGVISNASAAVRGHRKFPFSIRL